MADGIVPGDHVGKTAAEDRSEIQAWTRSPVDVFCAVRNQTETSIEPGEEIGEEMIGIHETGDPGQPKLGNQPVLKSAR